MDGVKDRFEINAFAAIPSGIDSKSLNYGRIHPLPNYRHSAVPSTASKGHHEAAAGAIPLGTRNSIG